MYRYEPNKHLTGAYTHGIHRSCRGVRSHTRVLETRCMRMRACQTGLYVPALVLAAQDSTPFICHKLTFFFCHELTFFATNSRQLARHSRILPPPFDFVGVTFIFSLLVSARARAPAQQIPLKNPSTLYLKSRYLNARARVPAQQCHEAGH